MKNHVLAEDVLAQMDLPPSRTTNVDGYAVYVPPGSDLDPGSYSVRKVGLSGVDYSDQGCYRVNTGGPLPGDGNAVVMVEDTKVIASMLLPP